MTATVTTTVVALVTSSSAAGALAAVGVVAVGLLIASLVMSELATSGGLRLRTWGRNLGIISASLLVVFTFMVSVKVWEILS